MGPKKKKEDDQTKKKRFVTFDEDELDEKLDQAANKNTKNADSKAQRAFTQFLTESKAPHLEFWTFPNTELDRYLAGFYVGARKQSGKKYKLNSMIQFKHALIRIVRDKRRDSKFDHKDLHYAPKAWKAMEEDLKKEGLAVTEGAVEMTEEGNRFTSRMAFM